MKNIVEKDKKKHFSFKKLFIFSLAILLVILISFIAYFFSVTSSVTLNISALNEYAGGEIKLVTQSGKPINSKCFNNSVNVSIDEISDDVKNAFISIEDKAFYNHNGINPKRIVGAIIANIKSGKNSQGASTITQQLIKNSQLTNEKTLNRKLKEIKLALNLEKLYSKDKILEMYLNTIYFGNGCYGIEQASLFYFSKKASELTLNEGAMLAAIINAPGIYNPLTNYDACKKRKDLVLKNMFNDGLITRNEYQENINSSVSINKTNSANAYCLEVINEACNLLNLDENQLKSKNLTIKTSLDEELQNEIATTILSNNFLPKEDVLVSSIVIENKTNQIISFASNSHMLASQVKRSPGSILKPILVYAPALESGKISPASIILDEEVDFNGYRPQNANKQYLGYVSVRTAFKKSLNTVAVKVLDMVTIAKAKEFATKLGITFSENDNSLALALGAMENGVTIFDLCNAYVSFANVGEFANNKIISQITDNNGNVLYQKNSNKNRVMSDATAFLITSLMRDTTLSGTAIRLSDLPYAVYSKTGTVGIKNSSNNSDAYCVSLTNDHTIITWIGAKNSGGFSASINGSTYPATINKKILESLYKNGNYPIEITKPESVVKLDYDAVLAQNEHIIRLANQFSLDKDKTSDYFNSKFIPETSTRLGFEAPIIKATNEDGLPLISYQTQKGASYNLYAETKNGVRLVNSAIGDNKVAEILDILAPNNEIIEYYLTSSLYDETKTSNKVKFYIS
ncbi:MAG: transglycosylase domain-containing protein [bacterium]|nr:transglycosylase domain-containing protein [bacterium]